MDNKEQLAKAIIDSILAHPDCGEELWKSREALALVVVSHISKVGDPLISCMLGLKEGEYTLHKHTDGPDDIWTVHSNNQFPGLGTMPMPIQEGVRVILQAQGRDPLPAKPTVPVQEASPTDYGLELVRQFHEVYDHPIKDRPHLSDRILNRFRWGFIEEENTELKHALGIPHGWWEHVKAFFGWRKKKDWVGVFDALLDLQYVLDGAFLSLGYWRWKRAGLDEVQSSNMSKLGADGRPIRRADGKILKGPNYRKPNLRNVLPLSVAPRE